MTDVPPKGRILYVRMRDCANTCNTEQSLRWSAPRDEHTFDAFFIAAQLANGMEYSLGFTLISIGQGEWYEGPGTYTVPWVVHLAESNSNGPPGTSWSIQNDDDKPNLHGTATITISNDEKTGSLDAVLKSENGDGTTVHVTGHWTCSN
jgi:hypothetical protein